MKENTGAIHAQVPVEVATFLLNEKRQDIHALEARFKINVVLIPNIHLETPNYTIERIKHEDLNREGAAEPSYKMVAIPEAEAAYTAHEQKPAAPEAMVKGITPSQPAPVIAPQPVAAPASSESAGLIGRILGWFKKAEQAAPFDLIMANANMLDLQEHMRLLYVGMTRAIDQLVITCDRSSAFVQRLEIALGKTA